MYGKIVMNDAACVRQHAFSPSSACVAAKNHKLLYKNRNE